MERVIETARSPERVRTSSRTSPPPRNGTRASRGLAGWTRTRSASAAASSCSRFGSTEQTIDYEITAYERPSSVTFVGDGKNSHGVHVISFAPREDGGTRVTYVADLGLKGRHRSRWPFLRGRLDQMSDPAVAGLKRALDARV